MKKGDKGLKVAVYPGSFDPVTLGHLDIIHRASGIFDKLVVAVLVNASKNPLFSLEERINLLREVTQDLPNVEIDGFQDLLIHYMQSKQANVIVRALRSVSDYEYELQLASLNRQIGDGVETLFMTSNPKYSYLSSSIVKEIARYHGPVKDLVPGPVERELSVKYRKL